MRSLTSKPAALRVSCTARMTSRARPSASSSGVVFVSSRNETAARQQRERLALGPSGGLEHEVVLPRVQRDPAHGDDAVGSRSSHPLGRPG